MEITLKNVLKLPKAKKVSATWIQESVNNAENFWSEYDKLSRKKQSQVLEDTYTGNKTSEQAKVSFSNVPVMSNSKLNARALKRFS